MTRTVWIRSLLLLILTLALVAPPAFAAGEREPAGPSVRGVLSALWQALAERIPVLGQGSETVSSDVWSSEDSGPGMDPNG
jgi:hypothetical protein